MTAYFDTSAMLKLVLNEDRSDSMRRFTGALKGKGGAPGTSWLGETEFRRAATRYGVASEAADLTLADFSVLDVPQEIYERAARLPMRDLRTLDALHIAVAIRAKSEFFVSYDARQCEAAASVGLHVVSP